MLLFNEEKLRLFSENYKKWAAKFNFSIFLNHVFFN